MITKNEVIRRKFWQRLFVVANEKQDLPYRILPKRWEKPKIGDHCCISSKSMYGGIKYCYLPRSFFSHVALRIHRGKEGKEESESLYKQLLEYQSEVENVFQGELVWDPYSSSQTRVATYKVQHTINIGGFFSDESVWNELHMAMVNVMIRLQRAFDPYLDKISI